jgi:hypothetical protein
MQTEELVRQTRPVDGLAVSRALQDLVPLSWQVTTERGKPVPLSSAGYVLHFGRTYLFRAAAAVERGPLPDLRLACRPPFVTRRGDARTVSRHGRAVLRALPFAVTRPSGWFGVLKAPYEVFYDDLEVTCTFSDQPKGVELTCPVVVRMRWGLGFVVLVLLGLLFGTLLAFVPRAWHEYMAGSGLAADPVQLWVSVRDHPLFWLWPLATAVLNTALGLTLNVGRLWRRSRELQARYDRRQLRAE